MDKAKAPIVAILVKHGKKIKSDVSTPIFSPNKAANDFVINNANAYLFTVLFDQNIPAEKAWTAPWLLKQRIGHWDMKKMVKEGAEVLREAVSQKPALHRYHYLGDWCWEAAKQLVDNYAGDAGNIWKSSQDARLMLDRFLGFKGIGQKKANMAIIILYDYFNVKISNLEQVDVPFDIHIRRVFLRTGLIDKDDIKEVIQVGRTYSPDYPGLIDSAAWNIGREYCRPENPRCMICVLYSSCPKRVNLGKNLKG